MLLQECQMLQDQVSALQEELSAHQRQQEEERDKNLDSIEFKKLQLQDLERQERWVSRSVYIFVCRPGCLCMCLLVFCGYRSQDLERQEQWVSCSVYIFVYRDVCVCVCWCFVATGHTIWRDRNGGCHTM